ncbi:hypothetical protein CC1G_15009 [Coprinopsis cinerea okayama7|uniref:Uncharacterized protein n=1 Tax=Coprinopsis cinerea (strain Okayama-7 / 130 / ATCC MYA-4618 / FGSC 9003) TaxID=240176 RepID=D6RP61_COPC7|nr:hypothetical protein CC1G_15009 [Coprinopsis cinerea okayama7\|eukprot:XP_002910678.1 hypothetical protein CC1G_15009 [Coprinopsis cinerea okayama7\
MELTRTTIFVIQSLYVSGYLTQPEGAHGRVGRPRETFSWNKVRGLKHYKWCIEIRLARGAKHAQMHPISDFRCIALKGTGDYEGREGLVRSRVTER